MCDIIQIVIQIWHHSLAARTPASHAGDRSSILRGATKQKTTNYGCFFCLPSPQEKGERARSARFAQPSLAEPGECHELNDCLFIEKRVDKTKKRLRNG